MSKVETATYTTPLRREAAILMLSPLLRSDIIKDPECDGLADFEKMLLEGFGGVVVFKHFSLKDPPLILKEIASLSKVVRRRNIIAPTSSHQVLPGEMAVTNVLGIRIDIIVTENTVKKAVRQGKPVPKLGEGNEQFIRDAVEIVRQGGILFIAPEGERKPNLKPYYERAEGQTPKRPVGFFLAAARGSNVENIAFLFVDLRLSGREDYWGKSSFNALDKYEVRIGRALTLRQVMEIAGKAGDVDEKVIFPEMQRTAAIQKPLRDRGS